MAFAKKHMKGTKRQERKVLAARVTFALVCIKVGGAQRFVSIAFSDLGEKTYWGLAICALDDKPDLETGKFKALQRMFQAHREGLASTKGTSVHPKFTVGSSSKSKHFNLLLTAQRAVRALSQCSPLAA